MSVSYHPAQGSVVTVNFDTGFLPPEMVKRRLAIVLSPAIKARVGLCTVVPLSTTDPEAVAPYHHQFTIQFKLPPSWGNIPRWVKGDMVCTVAWSRIDLLRLDKGLDGKRSYQCQTISGEDFTKVRRCVLHGLGLSPLTKHL
jgi:mRNA interferase MazF